MDRLATLWVELEEPSMSLWWEKKVVLYKTFHSRLLHRTVPVAYCTAANRLRIIRLFRLLGTPDTSYIHSRSKLRIDTFLLQ